MSIKNKFLLLFVLLLSLLVAVQTWLFYQYTDEVAQKIGETAFSVSKDTASVFVFNQDSFHQKQTYKYSQDGQTHTRTLIGPSNKDIRLRLTDGGQDKIIKIMSQENEFEIPIPRSPLQSSLATLKDQMLWLTLALFAAIILIAAYITYNMTKPLTALSNTAKKISQGQLGAKVKLKHSNIDKELSQTVGQFNKMSDALLELSQQKEQKQELEHFRELSDISRGLAHNLRNPLNTLLLSIEQLSVKSNSAVVTTEEDTLEKSRLTHIARKQVQRIDEWIKNFMLLMEQGLQPQSHQLKQIIQSALEHSINQDSANLIRYSTKQDYRLHCVESELCTIIQIVLQNAIEANHKAEPIDIGWFEEGDFLIVQISDQGKGISKSIAKQLFTPYVTNKTHGTGMGLYIAQRIVKHRYQGDIKVEDNQPQGTIVSIKFNKTRRAHEEL